MSDNINDLFANVKKMIDSGNIPPEVQQIMNNIQTSSQDSKTEHSSNNIPNLDSLLNSSSQNNFNIDMNTILKMKSIMENMNNKDDPRANLLNSLKPYLRDSKKNKIDQYVNMLNITKIADIMNNPNDKKNN